MNSDWPSYLNKVYVAIRYAKFYPGKLGIPEHQNSDIKIQLAKLKDLDDNYKGSRDQYVHFGTIKERIKMSLIEEDEIIRLSKFSENKNKFSKDTGTRKREGLLLMVENNRKIDRHEVFEIIAGKNEGKS